MQILECNVLLAGETEAATVVHRGLDTPVTYPEMLVLQYLHGDDAVTDVYELHELTVEDKRDNEDELSRLRMTYGQAAVADCFPGARPRLPSRDNRIKPRIAPVVAAKRKPAPDRAARTDLPELPIDGLGENE